MHDNISREEFQVKMLARLQGRYGGVFQVDSPVRRGSGKGGSEAARLWSEGCPKLHLVCVAILDDEFFWKTRLLHLPRRNKLLDAEKISILEI